MNRELKIWAKKRPTKRIWMKRAKRGEEIPAYALECYPGLARRLARLGLVYLPHIDAMIKR